MIPKSLKRNLPYGIGLWALFGILVLAFSRSLSPSPLPKFAVPSNDYSKEFFWEDLRFRTEGRSLFVKLITGHRIVLEGVEDDLRIQQIMHVTDTKASILEVETRIVREACFENGKLAEITDHYVALCEENSGLYQFAEHVFQYRGDEEIVRYEGSWKAGENRARPGLLVPGLPLVGARYYQEFAPLDRALDCAEVVSVGAELEVPAGRFKGCLQIRESSSIHLEEEGEKTFASGIGLIKDSNLEAVVVD